MAALIAPTAAAEVILTFIGAAIAFAGAFWLFRRQLTHDRSLAQKQLDADRTEHVNEARRLAGRQLGLSLIGAAQELDKMTDEELYDAISALGSAASRNAPGARTIWDARALAAHELDLDDVTFEIYGARARWWRGLRDADQRGRVRHLTQERQGAVMKNATDHFFIASDMQLRTLGRALMRWDGVGTVPTLDDRVHDGGVSTYEEAAQAAARVIAMEIKDFGLENATR